MDLGRVHAMTPRRDLNWNAAFKRLRNNPKLRLIVAALVPAAVHHVQTARAVERAGAYLSHLRITGGLHLPDKAVVTDEEPTNSAGPAKIDRQTDR